MIDDDVSSTPSGEAGDEPSAGMAGVTKGSRTRLGGAFLEAVQADFEAHGVDVIARLREEKPESYLKLLASILPKDLSANANALDELTDEELVRRIRMLDQTIRPLIEAPAKSRTARKSVRTRRPAGRRSGPEQG
ncbi:hypothetical protein [Sinorhizobium terangae]|uniref:Uncharacterized protein n=1 Tax=Sinorhizobium terangae TaxID=110322 RepID=A0A6N7L967_SINTE|nr:hypothetical protein [Sinorhizobium terangae]MBB4188038.1 hypothetical protein [Sinorhizobium terangae]MQX14417.1 hypothetical protein [Sinorhizobium terangae]WFU49503.1 hypothetical protein QA637_08955 [Sinorhizobium terangae]